METSLKPLYILGGIAGMCVGIFVLTFAVVAESIGTAFVPEIYSGEAIDYWIRNVIDNPNKAMSAVVSAVIGFGAMLVGGYILFTLIKGNFWQKYFALCGYLIGIPVAIYAFMERLSVQNQIIVLSKNKAEVLDGNELSVLLNLQEWHFTTEYVGPFFIVMIGTTFMAWAAKKEGLLPDWLCYWAFICCLLTVLFFIKSLPATLVEIASLGAGPIHMLWFFAMGVVLLRKFRNVA